MIRHRTTAKTRRIYKKELIHDTPLTDTINFKHNSDE